MGVVYLALDTALNRSVALKVPKFRDRDGPKIVERGIYRDPVRSSKSHVVKASGLRWISLMLIVDIPWIGRAWALPFLTVVAPSKNYDQRRGRKHRTVVDKGCKIPEGLVVGENPEEDAKRFHVTKEGIVLVTPAMLGQNLYARLQNDYDG